MDGDRQTSMPSPLRGPRFSLRALLLVVLLPAIAFAVLFSMPDPAAMLMGFTLAIATPALLTIGIMYGSRWQRTFCVGALFPCGTLFFTSGFGMNLFDVQEPLSISEWLDHISTFSHGYRVYCGTSWLLAIIVGSASVALHWTLLKPNSQKPD